MEFIRRRIGAMRLILECPPTEEEAREMLEEALSELPHFFAERRSDDGNIDSSASLRRARSGGGR
jgi:hypothetical protein